MGVLDHLIRNGPVLPEKVQIVRTELVEIDPASVARKVRATQLMVDGNSRLAVVANTEVDPIPVSIAIRGLGTVEVLIPIYHLKKF